MYIYITTLLNSMVKSIILDATSECRHQNLIMYSMKSISKCYDYHQLRLLSALEVLYIMYSMKKFNLFILRFAKDCIKQRYSIIHFY